ncbi:MAG: hypothetical protein WBV45_04205, partial [Lutimonas sp.]
MKSRIHLICVLLTSLLIGGTANGQILKKLKKRVQEATEDVIVEKAAQKTAQETGKVMDSLLNIDPDYEQNNPEQWEMMFGQGGADVPIESSYQFGTNVMYTMEFTSEKENSVVDYSMWFSDKDNYMATEVSQIQSGSKESQEMPSSVLSVIDEKNKAMIILMEEQKIAQVISMDKIKEIATEENQSDGLDASFEAIKKNWKFQK